MIFLIQTQPISLGYEHLLIVPHERLDSSLMVRGAPDTSHMVGGPVVLPSSLHVLSLPQSLTICVVPGGPPVSPSLAQQSWSASLLRCHAYKRYMLVFKQDIRIVFSKALHVFDRFARFHCRALNVFRLTVSGKRHTLCSVPATLNGMNHQDGVGVPRCP